VKEAVNVFLSLEFKGTTEAFTVFPVTEVSVAMISWADIVGTLSNLSRSQRPRSLRHELSLPAQNTIVTPSFRIQLEAWICMCVYKENSIISGTGVAIWSKTNDGGLLVTIILEVVPFSGYALFPALLPFLNAS
jgi:hypothetical protein